MSVSFLTMLALIITDQTAGQYIQQFCQFPISGVFYLCVPAHGKDAAERYTIHAYDGQVFVDTEYIEG